ncbi:MAG: DUF4838 domain-containing protein [Armatimonadetes bacterium]|nr:DUF4838 domain-containing protein [Armatimonadota bacterium]
MMSTRLLAVLVVLHLAAGESTMAVDIVAEGKASCEIRIDAAGRDSSVVSFAARELRKYASRMTGVALEMAAQPGGPAISLGLARAAGAAFDGNDAYTVVAEGNTIEIRGETERGVLHGVYALLEYWGCRWYEHEEKDQVVPERKSLSFSGRIASAPDFPIRSLQVVCWDLNRVGRIIDWMGKNRYNWIEMLGTDLYDRESVRQALRQRGIVPIICSHTLSNVFGIKDFTETRPQLFAEVKGVRGKVVPYRACSTHPEAADLVARRVVGLVRKYPEMKVIGLTPDDGSGGWCECEGCRRIQPEGRDPPTNTGISSRM